MPPDTAAAEPHPLFAPYDLAGVPLTNRFVMAPMTRSRATQPGDVPQALMAAYYAQRASAGLIITEATQVSLQGKGYANTPGIYSPEQVAGWRGVTRAVHSAGGRIVLQLWHVGRMSSARVNGLQPVAPSALPAPNAKVYVFDGADASAAPGDATMIPTDTPRAMTEDEIHQTVADFASGARNAIDAGFDAVEIHAANGYLIEQFLRADANHRTDDWGGTPENRLRMLLDTTRAVIAAVGPDRTGVRLSLKNGADPEVDATTLPAAAALQKLGITYLHLSEADWEGAAEIPEGLREKMRAAFRNTLIVTGSQSPDRAAGLLNRGHADLVGFGRKFLTNPDYPARVAAGAELNELVDTHSLFGGGGARGYTDYPAMPKG